MKTEKYKSFLGENDYKFLNRVFSGDQSNYIKRLENIGFDNLDTVLDAGCGFGQWSFAMAKLNKKVVGIDASSERLLVANEMAKDSGVNNIEFQYGLIDKTNFEDNSFDAIFCYSVILVTDYKAALKEFYRILKPGGKLYVNANGLGFYINRWMTSHNAASDFDPRLSVATAFKNTWLLKNGFAKEPGQTIISGDEFADELDRLKYRNVIKAGEGKINITGKHQLTPFFSDEYFGLEGVYEVVAEK
ncbi:MAG: Methylase involved in ubiquinone/menaquinone biosynthesis-like protein [Bacteroidetes bacterium]|jgi:ubiquinone/menaquinone biosynthesis C-methylase UbiE|nr:Methylase involved in ubiquinone/menaquinone biosynthesis-like protein [Bacteroidota bacterium]